MRPLCALVMMTILCSAGCGKARTESVERAPAPLPAPTTHFDSSTAGSIRGHAVWSGTLPVVPPFDVRFNVDSSPILREKQQRSNPNAPSIDPASRAVAGAVVFLRGVDPRRSRPWDHAPVRVEIRQRQLHVMQGTSDSKVGFVRQGDAIEIVSREADYHSVHANGAAFFTLPFPDANQPLTRALKEKGCVELSNHAGYFWMRSHVWVTDHPYFTQTDAAGNFELTGVPPGDYDLVCWMPNWNVASFDRDPETSFMSRVRFAAPVEVIQKVSVGTSQRVSTALEVSPALFSRNPTGMRGPNATPD